MQGCDPVSNTPLLEVTDLEVEFATYGGSVKAVRGVSFTVEAGKTLAIVGESGCGKSVTVQTIMGLIPIPPGRITNGSTKLRGREILGRPYLDGKDIRGDQIGMIFQDPMTSLNPTMSIGAQMHVRLRCCIWFAFRKRNVELDNIHLNSRVACCNAR
jgi:ABC-type dipeptide/oligopeptide/nickel transport system ATPase component